MQNSSPNLKVNAKQARAMKATVANPDAWGRLIGPQNIAPIKIDGEETMVLLDGGAQISSISKKWVEQAGLPIFELENLVDILQAGGSSLDYEGYTKVTITSKKIPSLNYTFPVLIVPYTEYHNYVPLTLGTKTLYHLHDSGILDTDENLPTSWNYARKDIELKRKLEGQPEKPLGFAKNQKAVKIGPSQTKTFHCLAKAQTHGMTVNVIVEPMEKSQLPPGLECQYSYSEIQSGSSKIAVSIRNHSQKVLKIPKEVKIGQIYTANRVPKILNNAIKVTKLEKDIENCATKPSTANPMKEKVDSSPSEPADWLLEKLDLSGMSKWPPDLQAKAKALLLSYSDIFSKDEMDLGKTNLVKHHIDLTNYTPFKDKYRRIPPHLYEEVRSHLKEMLDLGAIRKSQSSWSSPIVLVRKKDGKLRFCIDLRKLNQRTVRDNYSLPKVEHMLEQLIGSEWFCSLDLKSGYWQVELTEESKPYTEFTCGPLGFFECDKMPFGATNAPATFQRLMENCLGSLNLTWCVVYLDDIIVYGKDPEELLLRLGGVFEKLRKAGLKLKPSKCNFFKEEIEFLGHVVSKEGIATNPSKVQAIQDWPIPETVHDIKSFTGFVGYYRKFIPNFSKIAKPLNDLLNGKVNSKRANKRQFIEWGSQQQEAFDTLKEALMSTPILGYPNYEKPFILHTDASLEGLGAVLYQEDEKGIKRVISYASRSLSKSEKNYPAHKLEFLALKWAVSETNGQCERFNRTLCDMLGTLEAEEKANWKAFIHTLTHAYNATRNSSTGYSPFFLMFGRHPRLPVDVAFGIHRAGNGVTFAKSKYVDRLQRRLAHAYKTAKTFTDKESSRQKALFDKRSKDLRLQPGDLCLVKKTAWQARHKIQNKWEDDLYVILSQNNEDIPVYTIRNTVTLNEKTLHRNLLLPLAILSMFKFLMKKRSRFLLNLFFHW